MTDHERSNTLTIVDDGQPAATICVPDDASETERFAAEELRSYLAEMSGATLAVQMDSASTETPNSIRIGQTFLDRETRESIRSEDIEAFAVDETNGTLTVGGATERGTLYAVYDLLERHLGCRWLGPGPEWEEIPTRASLSIPRGTEYTDQPAMTYRSLSYNQAFDTQTWRGQCMDWSVKRRLNTGYGKFNFEGGAIPNELPQGAQERGGFRAWETTHLTGALIDPREHFDEHPEWFALVDGERRRASDDRRHYQQFCTTNPGLIDEVTDKLRQLFDAHPDFEFLPITQGDGTAFCECEVCRGLDTGDVWRGGDRNRKKARPRIGEPSERTKPVLTERWLTFVNEIARRLRETHPDKKVYTLAYHQTFRPPDPSGIVPEPNVMIRLVNSRPNYLCFIHQLDRDDCPNHDQFRSGLRDWLELTPGGVTGYFYMPHSTFCSLPFVAAEKFAADISFLADSGVVGFYGQCSTSAWGVYGLTRYVTAKLLWDPSRDVEEVINEYCEAAFQNAASHMRAFYDVLERGRASGEHITDGIWSAFDTDTLSTARGHLDDAHDAAEQERVVHRLRQIEVGFRYGELAYAAWATAYPAIVENDSDALRDAIKTGRHAIAYLESEASTAPHHAAVAGKLERVHLERWETELASMDPSTTA